MKKILTIAVAFVAVAMTVSASNVKWGLDEGETLPFATGTIYLIQSSDTPDTTGWDKKESFSTSDLTGTVVLSDSFTGSFYAGEDSVTSVGGSTGRMPFYMAAISSDGKSIAVMSDTITINIKSSDLSVTAKAAGSDFSSFTAPVPEPTAVALIALGLAALGLKRKVA